MGCFILRQKDDEVKERKRENKWVGEEMVFGKERNKMGNGEEGEEGNGLYVKFG